MTATLDPSYDILTLGEATEERDELGFEVPQEHQAAYTTYASKARLNSEATLRKQAWEGFPLPLRPSLWSHMCGATTLKQKSTVSYAQVCRGQVSGADGAQLNEEVQRFIRHKQGKTQAAQSSSPALAASGASASDAGSVTGSVVSSKPSVAAAPAPRPESVFSRFNIMSWGATSTAPAAPAPAVAATLEGAVNAVQAPLTDPLSGPVTRVLTALHRVRPAGCIRLHSGTLAGLLLLVPGMDEETACWLLVALVDNVLPDHGTLTSMQTDSLVLRELLALEAPAMYAHHSLIEAIGVNWMTALFAGALPSTTTLRVWDALFAHGPSVLFKVVVAVSLMSKEVLVDGDNDAPSTFMRVARGCVDADALLLAAQEVPLTDAELSEARARALRAVQGQSDLMLRLTDVTRLHNLFCVSTKSLVGILCNAARASAPNGAGGDDKEPHVSTLSTVDEDTEDDNGDVTRKLGLPADPHALWTYLHSAGTAVPPLRSHSWQLLGEYLCAPLSTAGEEEGDSLSALTTAIKLVLLSHGDAFDKVALLHRVMSRGETKLYNETATLLIKALLSAFKGTPVMASGADDDDDGDGNVDGHADVEEFSLRVSQNVPLWEHLRLLSDLSASDVVDGGIPFLRWVFDGERDYAGVSEFLRRLLAITQSEWRGQGPIEAALLFHAIGRDTATASMSFDDLLVALRKYPVLNSFVTSPFAHSGCSKDAVLSAAPLPSPDDVAIVDACLQGAGMLVGGHTEYVISVREHEGVYQIRKRFSDFARLHESLQHLSTMLPALPDKVIAKNSIAVVEQRKAELEMYLRSVLASEPALAHDAASQAIRLFLHRDASGEAVLKVICSTTAAATGGDIADAASVQGDGTTAASVQSGSIDVGSRRNNGVVLRLHIAGDCTLSMIIDSVCARRRDLKLSSCRLVTANRKQQLGHTATLFSAGLYPVGTVRTVAVAPTAVVAIHPSVPGATFEVILPHSATVRELYRKVKDDPRVLATYDGFVLVRGINVGKGGGPTPNARLSEECFDNDMVMSGLHPFADVTLVYIAHAPPPSKTGDEELARVAVSLPPGHDCDDFELRLPKSTTIRQLYQAVKASPQVRARPFALQRGKWIIGSESFNVQLSKVGLYPAGAVALTYVDPSTATPDPLDVAHTDDHSDATPRSGLNLTDGSGDHDVSNGIGGDGSTSARSADSTEAPRVKVDVKFPTGQVMSLTLDGHATVRDLYRVLKVKEQTEGKAFNLIHGRRNLVAAVFPQRLVDAGLAGAIVTLHMSK